MDNKAVGENGSWNKVASREWLALALLVALVFLTYSITLTSRFGLLDDYAFLLNGITGSDATFDLLVGAGRPLNALLLDAGFAAAGSIENLALLRLVTLVGIAALASALYVFARRHGLSSATSVSIGAGVALLPSFQVYAAWAQHFTTPFAALLSLVAAYLLTPAHSAERPRVHAILLAAILLATGLLMYQPTAMFFCTAVLISVMASPQPLRDWTMSRLASAAAAFGVAMTAAFVALKIGQRLYPSGSSRYGLLNDPLGKAEWFLREPLWNALSLFTVPADNAVALACVALVCAGLLILCIRKGTRAGCFVLALSILCLLGAYLPNLATAENWASYRSIGALAASVVAVVSIVIIEPVTRYVARNGAENRRRSAHQAGMLAGLVVIVCLAMHAQKTVSHALVLPNVAEIDNVSQYLQQHANTRQISSIFVRPSAWTDSAAAPMAYDEFGLQSSIKAYYAHAIVDILRKSLDILHDATITVIEHGNPAAVPNDNATLYVDFASFASSGKYRAVRSPASSGKTIVLADISDYNWTHGIWTNPDRPAEYSFVFSKADNGMTLRQGDRIKLAHSGDRAVLKVVRFGDYTNVLVDGPPLLPADGHPAEVAVIR
ncbi:glucosyltransferase domain-containing protein [Massilia suwonensis]|uniref:Glucosyltransferase domain-containing protein n=1 Tax=Massilia suwonensis TaxID=648895 RepID=A0ABW0MT84_9BURK